MVFGYIMGVRKFLVFDVFYMEVLGGIAAAVLMVPLCLLKTTRPLLSVIYQAVLPCFALMLVVLNSFPVGGGPQWLAATASYVFYGAIAILALASLCAMAHAGEFSPASIYGLAVAAFSVVSLAGIFSGSLPAFADYGGGPILLVVSTCYFAILIGATLVGAWRREGAELEGRTGSGAKDAADGLRERCERVADDGGLSPREREILGYLGRGHGIVFVANTLVISAKHRAHACEEHLPQAGSVFSRGPVTADRRVAAPPFSRACSFGIPRTRQALSLPSPRPRLTQGGFRSAANCKQMGGCAWPRERAYSCRPLKAVQRDRQGIHEGAHPEKGAHGFKPLSVAGAFFMPPRRQHV